MSKKQIKAITSNHEEDYFDESELYNGGMNRNEFIRNLKLVNKNELLFYFIEAQTGITEREIRLAVENHHPF